MWTKVHQYILVKEKMILGEGPMQRSNKTIITTEAKYLINITRSRKNFCLSLHDNKSNSFLYFNHVKTYQFKARASEIKPYPLCLDNISKDFTVDRINVDNIFLIYDVACKTPYGAKSLRIIFKKVEECIRICHRTKYLGLFHSNDKYERMFDRIRYHIMSKKQYFRCSFS